MNSVNLIGRVCQTPTIVAYESGKTKATFNLATNTYSGGNKEANFFPCEAWGKTADLIAKHGEKGALVGVSGSLRQQSYVNQQKQKVSRIYIVVNTFEKLSSPAQKLEQEALAYDVSNSISTIESYSQVGVLQEDYAENIDIGSDDLPF